jgi:hypothetical protein
MLLLWVAMNALEGKEKAVRVRERERGKEEGDNTYAPRDLSLLLRSIMVELPLAAKDNAARNTPRRL